MQIEMMVNKKKDICDDDEKEKIFVTMIVTMQGERRDDLLPLLCPPHTVTFFQITITRFFLNIKYSSSNN